MLTTLSIPFWLLSLTGKLLWKPHWSVPSKPTLCEWLLFLFARAFVHPVSSGFFFFLSPGTRKAAPVWSLPSYVVLPRLLLIFVSAHLITWLCLVDYWIKRRGLKTAFVTSSVHLEAPYKNPLWKWFHLPFAIFGGHDDHLSILFLSTCGYTTFGLLCGFYQGCKRGDQTSILVWNSLVLMNVFCVRPEFHPRCPCYGHRELIVVIHPTAGLVFHS